MRFSAPGAAGSRSDTLEDTHVSHRTARGTRGNSGSAKGTCGSRTGGHLVPARPFPAFRELVLGTELRRSAPYPGFRLNANAAAQTRS